MIIEIKHQLEKTVFRFKVKDENNLTSLEVRKICNKMNVDAVFIKGKYYSK